MNLIKETHGIYAYKDPSLISKYIYLKRSNEEYDMFIIYKLNDISSTDGMKDWETTHEASVAYKFVVPRHNKEVRKGYLYDNDLNIKVDIYKDELYEMTPEEFNATYMSFLKNDGMIVNELPAKIIQDYVNT